MTEEQDIMTAMWKGDIVVERPSLVRVEIGNGKGLGNKYGTYREYTKNLESLGREIEIYIGKNLNEDSDGTISIVNETRNFNEGDDVVVLVKFKNLLYGVSLNLTWLGADLEYRGAYEIPIPLSMKYNWWDSYSVWFYAPELRSGEYKVEINGAELKDKGFSFSNEIYFDII